MDPSFLLPDDELAVSSIDKEMVKGRDISPMAKKVLE
jgi:hypothetical protein